ncbi:hypothetical protein CXIVA_25290 [Clostridium sp. SY8519]|uniref:hypothetical protein n=1 Tax=Clostridium sp. (strain SY8519) TaxID=1042156 RepID=UPI00021722C3|nr:hypothetical protein [Clostridium sp. SY8519]BAK48497.1 hypothetical protein CXIVA_25290 [Clostridium sp. SY8519]
MDTSLTVKTMRRQSWALMVQEQANSGLSVRDWCAQNDRSSKVTTLMAALLLNT